MSKRWRVSAPPSTETTLAVPESARPPAEERFRRWGIIAWSTIGILILAGGLLWAFTRVQEIFPSLVVALIVVYVLNPVVSQLEKRGMPRLAGSCLSYFVLLAVVTVGIALLIPVLIDQGQELARDFPRTWDRITDVAHNVTDWLDRRFGVSVNVREWLGGHTDLVTDNLGRVGSFLAGAATTAGLIVIGFVLGFYLLVDLPRLRRSIVRLIPPDRRQEAKEVASEIGTAMGGFFRGQLLVALIVGIMSSFGLWLVGLPYWAVVGMIAGFFNIVPMIGPFVGAIPAILIAAALAPPITIVWVVLVLTGVQQIDNHFISPNVMRWTVRLHPVTIMIALIAGATLAGFFGMLIAVPIVASVKMIASHFWRTRVPWGQEVFEEEEDLELIPDEQAEPEEIEAKVIAEASSSDTAAKPEPGTTAVPPAGSTE
jgi:predicted PurR-regulated permease PerM